MILDRAYQLELLTKLSEAYPDPVPDYEINDRLQGEDRSRYIANMIYLEEHGLVESGITKNVSSDYSLTQPRINCHGMDLLADDGGLTAILGVVTIKIHDETMKALIEERISVSGASQSDKHRMISELRSLPSSAIKHLTMKLLDLGLEHAPDALPLIEKVLSQFAKS